MCQIVFSLDYYGIKKGNKNKQVSRHTAESFHNTTDATLKTQIEIGVC